MRPSLTSSRVAIVSGKGGVGKTAVAAALAKAAAASGRKVLLLEVENRNGIAPLFGIPSLTYAEQVLGPNLRAESVVPDEALIEYLYLFYGIKRIGRALAGTKAVEFATNVAPGLRDILLIGKVKEAEARRAHDTYAFDLVVLDAPPTGRLPRFLDAPRAIVDLVRAGPIRGQAQGVLDMISDARRAQVILVTLPEEMPAQETIESRGTLESMGVAVGPVVVNRVANDRFSPEDEKALLHDAPATLAAAAERSGAALPTATLERLATVAASHARRERQQASIVRRLKRELKLPMITLPDLMTPSLGGHDIDALAEALTTQGAIG